MLARAARCLNEADRICRAVRLRGTVTRVRDPAGLTFGRVGSHGGRATTCADARRAIANRDGNYENSFGFFQ